VTSVHHHHLYIYTYIWKLLENNIHGTNNFSQFHEICRKNMIMYRMPFVLLLLLTMNYCIVPQHYFCPVTSVHHHHLYIYTIYTSIHLCTYTSIHLYIHMEARKQHGTNNFSQFHEICRKNMIMYRMPFVLLLTMNYCIVPLVSAHSDGGVISSSSDRVLNTKKIAIGRSDVTLFASSVVRSIEDEV